MRRITERRIAEGDTAIEAEKIARERHGKLDGVEVDFRHPDIPDDWLPRPQWYVAGRPPNNAGILFPSEALALDRLDDSERARYPDKLEAIEARPGDRICVDRALPQIIDGRLDHPHDRQCWLVYLRLERPSGELIKLPEPLSFYGSTQVRDGPTREAFDHILDRICKHAGVREIHELRDPYGFRWSASLDLVAQHFGAEAYDDYFRLLQMLGDNGPAKALLRAIANDAALAGFMLAKVEMRKAEAVALAGERNRQRGTAKVTRLDWRERAKQIWADHPDYRRTKVANIIAEGTDDDPGSIMRAIKPLDPHRH